MTSANNLETKKAQVKEFFSVNAPAYAAGYRKPTQDLSRLLALLSPEPNWLAYDIGAGTGRITAALAPLVHSVTAIDLTPAMEVEFWKTIEMHGLHNVQFVTGDAEALPIPAGSADLVTCARAAHHFLSIEQAVREMSRVLKPGGRLGLIDMVAPEEPAGAVFLNALEQARDTSHVCALSHAAWCDTLAKCGFAVTACEIQEEDMSLSDWLSPVPADGDAAQQVQRLAATTPPPVRQYVFTTWEPEPVIRKRRVIITAYKQQ